MSCLVSFLLGLPLILVARGEKSRPTPTADFDYELTTCNLPCWFKTTTVIITITIVRMSICHHLTGPVGGLTLLELSRLAR